MSSLSLFPLRYGEDILGLREDDEDDDLEDDLISLSGRSVTNTHLWKSSKGEKLLRQLQVVCTEKRLAIFYMLSFDMYSLAHVFIAFCPAF